MNHSEATFSIEQLLGFKVCLDFTDITLPPRLSFESLASSQMWQSTAMRPSGLHIKLETTHLALDGRCILKFYAIDPLSDESSTASTSSSPATSSVRQESFGVNGMHSPKYGMQYNSGSPCPGHSPSQQSHPRGYGITPKAEETSYLPVASQRLHHGWSSLAGSHFDREGFEAGHSIRDNALSGNYSMGSFGLQDDPLTSDDCCASSMNVHDTSGNLSTQSTFPASQHYAGHFSGLSDPPGGSFFAGAFSDPESLTGLEYQSEALGYVVGEPCSRQQPEIDLSRAVYSFNASSSPPYHKTHHCILAPLPTQSEDMESPPGSTTPSTTVYSLSERSSPEPDSSNRADAGTSSAVTSAKNNGPAPSASKRRGKVRSKPSSLYIYHCPHPTCTRVFRSEYTCRVHSGVHIPKPRKVIPCTHQGCVETFTRQHDRLRHEVAQHGKICEFSCSACHRFFSSAAMLEKHKCSSYRR